MKWNFLVLILFLCGSAELINAEDGTLRFVHVIWRHGDRAPSDGTFPNDVNNTDETWPQGMGELTQDGMRQHQNLGRYLRKRYVDDAKFLSANYSAKEIYVRSSSYNRTIMSAMSNLAGMYPVPDIDMLENIPIWQPIPIHSQPREIDPMLWMDCPCPTEVALYWNETMASNEVKSIEKENAEFLEFLRINSGLERVTLDDVWDIWDPLNCERIHNSSHTWPHWVDDAVFEKLTNLTDLSTTFYYKGPKIQWFRGALLFNDIAIRFNNKATNSKDLRPPELRYYVYSAHDTTMMALLQNMDAYNAPYDHTPEYATAILFELHEKTKGSFTVETYYVNVTNPTDAPVRIMVKDCDKSGVDCPLDQFVKTAGSNAPANVEEWFDKCGRTQPVKQPTCDNSNQPALIAAIVLGVTTGVFLLAFLVLLILFCRLKNTHKVHYGH